MKKCGDLYTAKGKGLAGVTERIQLFDGRFDTAFRLVSIDLANTDPYEGLEISIVVKTLEETTSSDWDWSVNSQVGWAVMNAPSLNRWGYNTFVDPDNLIVEDIYLTFGSSTADTEMNYMLKFQKYDLTEWRGALAMVRNRAQGNGS